VSDRGDLSRDILLRIRAQNLSTAEFNQAKAAVDSLTASLDKQIQAANRAEISEKELSATLTKLEQATRNFTGLATAIDQFKSFERVIALSEQRVTTAREKLEAYRAKVEQTKDTSAAAEKMLGTLSTRLEKQETQLRANTQTFAEMGQSLTKAGVDINNIVEAENRLKTAADQAGAAITKLSNAKLNLAENTRKAREESRKLAEAQAAEAAEQRKAAEQYAESVKIQEQGQLQAFQAFRATETARAQAHARFVAQVREGLVIVRREQAEKVAAARATADAQIAEEQRVAQRTREIAAQREREALANFRALQARMRGGQPQPGGGPQPSSFSGAAPTPRPGAGPRTDAMGRPGRGAAGAVGFLGLRPYELTNLGYQVNDVFTGLASGQNTLQILAQQGPQFLQIFGTAALRWFPAVGAAALAASVAIGVVHNGLRNLALNREFEAVLATNVRGIKESAADLTALAKAIRDTGVSLSDSVQLVRQSRAANIRPELRPEFAELARNISRVEGTDIKEAMQDVIKGLTGGREAIEDLIAKYPELTEAQLNHVRTLLAEGKQGQAQIETLRLLAERYRDAEAKGTSPFRKATDLLTASWNHLMDTLTNSEAFASLIQRITNVITKMDELVQWVDKFMKKFDDPKWEFIRKIFEGLSGPALPPWLTPGNPNAIVPSVPGAIPNLNNPQPPGTEFPITGSRFVTTREVTLSSESLKQLGQILTEASNALPPGYRVEAFSGSRPGAVVQRGPNAGQPSEHGGGRAIDVRIVDSSGREVPGSMGAGGPLYQQLDTAVARVAGKLFPGVAVAIGSTFSDPDAGHYSIGGSEAATNAARRGAGGTTTGDTARQGIALDRIILAERERIAIIKARNEAEEEAVIRAQALRRAQEAGKDTDKQKQAADLAVEAFRYEKLKERNKEENDQAKQRITDGRDFARIEEGGLKARQEALAKGITNYKDLRAIQQEGEAETRAQVQREKQEAEAIVAIKKQIASLDRENNQAYQSDLDRALEAVKQKYISVYEAIKKQRERATTTEKAALDELEQAAKRSEGIAEGRARISSAQSSARASITTRQELISTYNDLRAAGEISIDEQQKKIKEAFELTTPAIKKAADELEAFLKTAEGLKLPPEEIAKITAQIQKMRVETKYVDPFWKGLRDTVGSSLGTGLETAFNSVAEAIGGAIAKTKEWKDVLGAVKNAGMNLFAQLLKDIASYLIKAEAAKLASSLFGVDTGGSAAGSGIGGFFGRLLGFGSQTGANLAGASIASSASTAAPVAVSTLNPGVSALFFHRGGIVGQGGIPTLAPASWWDHAPRYHRGSVVGMGVNEQAAILQRGEEVLTRDDPRNAMNRRGGGGSDINIRSVLVDDPQRIPNAMGSSAGERIVVQHLIKNAATIRAIVKG